MDGPNEHSGSGNLAEACAGMHRDYLASTAKLIPDLNYNTAEQNRHNTNLVRGLAARFAANAVRVSEGHCDWVSDISISAQNLELEAQQAFWRYQFCDSGENCLGVTGSGKLIVHAPAQGDSQHGEETEQRSVAEICSDMRRDFFGKIARCYPEENPSTAEQNRHNSNLVRGIAALLAAGDARMAQGHCDWLSETSHSAQSLEEEAQEYLGQGRYRFCDDDDDDDEEGCLAIDSSGQLSGQMVAHVAVEAQGHVDVERGEDEHGEEPGNRNVAETCARLRSDYMAAMARCHPETSPHTAEQNRHNSHLVKALAAMSAANAVRSSERRCDWVSQVASAFSAEPLQEEAQEYFRLGRYQFCDSGENCLGIDSMGELTVNSGR